MSFSLRACVRTCESRVWVYAVNFVHNGIVLIRICPNRVFVRLKVLSLTTPRPFQTLLNIVNVCVWTDFFSLLLPSRRFSHCADWLSIGPQLTSHCEMIECAMCVARFYYLFHPFPMSSILFSILYFISLFISLIYLIWRICVWNDVKAKKE